MHCVCDDGSEATYSAGEAYAISPGHDAWVVGDKPAVVYEFAFVLPNVRCGANNHNQRFKGGGSDLAMFYAV